MRLFADHCVHRGLVRALAQKGHDIERALEQGMEKALDEEIFRYAVRRSRVLISFDRDFTNIIRFDIRRSKGVVVVLMEGMSRDEIIERVLNFFQRMRPKVLKGKLFVISPSEVIAWAR